jgi:hypothetical protein
MTHIGEDEEDNTATTKPHIIPPSASSRSHHGHTLKNTATTMTKRIG